MTALPVIPADSESYGACCMNQNNMPLKGLMLGTVGKIPDELATELWSIAMGPLHGTEGQESCVWLDRVTGKCKHYEYRPQACRDFELASPSCLEARKKVGMK